MRILSSDSSFLSAERSYIAGRELRESLSVQRDGQRIDMTREARSEVQASSRVLVQRQLNEAAPVQAAPRWKNAAESVGPLRTAAPAESTGSAIELAPDDESLRKLRMLLAALGRQAEDIDKTLKGLLGRGSLPVSGGAPETGETPPAASGDFLNYSYSLKEWQGESLSIRAGGSLTTADGRQIQYGLSLEMMQVSYREERIELRQGAALQDPLVLNLGGGPLRLDGERRVSFDLDADGQRDSMASLASHSAFLALDRNGNGRIDDGRELFGALSGDGFADLAAFDEDGNGFIDEGDSVFNRLRLWRPDEQGEGELVDLRSAGIGAIGLGRVHADFDLQAGGQLEGRVRSTGIFLFESGQAGSVQQVDLAI